MQTPQKSCWQVNEDNHVIYAPKLVVSSLWVSEFCQNISYSAYVITSIATLFITILDATIACLKRRRLRVVD